MKTILKEDLKNKYIFWDIDGTLAEYRFNGHVGDPEGINNGIRNLCWCIFSKTTI